ncbi:kinesin heavy chain-like [Gambusia affinis]|uniref:kinesin heavy chain-like n=1 Tax=Gambusia affinis TaxID=33528 RepID=UPI001CDBB41A|nr:kinesin heavy chain-like [Gambusia affinis]
MTVCLYNCLSSAGLQRHYSRFTLMGVYRAAHLSTLSMEDYPRLGVCSMDDRARLFQLVQLVKSLDLRSLRNDDIGIYNECDYEEGNELFPANNSFSPDGYGNSNGDMRRDKSESGAISSAFSDRPSYVCRRLDFSTKNTDQRSCSHFEDTIHVYASRNRNDDPVHENGSATPIQLGLHSRKAVVCDLRQSKNSKLNERSCSCDPHNVQSIKLHVTRESSMLNSHIRLVPKRETFNKLNPPPAAVTSESFINKPSAQKDRKTISRKKKSPADDTKPTPVYEARRTAGYNYGLPLSPPQAAKHGEGQRIIVCVRKRPLTHAECKRGEVDVVTTKSGECVAVVHESKEAVDLTEYILQHRYHFDQVFGEESSNEEVYLKTAYPLVQHMLSGGKATCFAYGQTGAGKTHTMLGSSPAGAGLYALAVHDIFAHLSATSASLLVYVSFFEIYCGQLYDLLEHRKRLFAREDGKKMVHISGLRDIQVDSVSSLLEVISQGTAERTQGTSGVNPLSSRSHALLQIQLRNLNQQIAGRIWFVDLAGSERASDAKEPNKQSRIEGAEINQSLLALKECIRSLDKEESHTPFRQSKLTQVLKDSFVGDSKTCMIANISPGHSATEHTLNTLRYADRVKELRGQNGPIGRKRSRSNMTRSDNSNTGNRRNIGTSNNPKLGNQNKSFSPKTQTSPRISQPVFCSTPTKSSCLEETQSRNRKVIELEHISPIRGSLAQTEDRCLSRGLEVREDGRTENETYSDIHSHCVIGKHTRAVGMLGQQNNGAIKGGDLTFSKRESGFCHREKENYQQTTEERKREEWTEMRRQAESCRDTCKEVEELKERELHKVDEKEKVRHLREYHQQLQQFSPSPMSSYVHLLSSSSFSSSSLGSLSSLLHSSNFSFSTQTDPCLEETSGVQTETSANHTKNVADDNCENERKVKTEAAGKSAGRKEEKKLAGMKGGHLRDCWMGSTEVESEQIPTKTEAHLSGCLDSEVKGDVDLQKQQTTDIAWSHKQKGVSDYYSKNLHLQFNALSSVCENSSKMSLLPQVDISRNSLSCFMDPLSISQLHLEQQRQPEEFFLPPLEPPHSKSLQMNMSATYDTATAAGHHEQKKCITITVNGRGTDTPYSIKDHGNKEKNLSTSEKNLTASIIKFQASSLIKSTEDCSSQSTHNSLECTHNIHSIIVPDLSKQDSEPQCGSLNSTQANDYSISRVAAEQFKPAELGGEESGNQQIKPTIHLFTMDRLDHARLHIIEVHLEQLKEMEAICHKEGELLCQQHDMVFVEFVHKLDELLERKAQCVHSMKAHLRPYLKTNHHSTQED